MSAHAHRDKHDAHGKLIVRLRDLASDAARLTDGLGEADLSRRVMEGKWSLKELLCHLWRLQQVFEGRIDAMLATENPPVASYSPDGDAEFDKMAAAPGAEVRDGFLRDRERFAERLEQLGPADWHRPGRHPDFPRYDVHFQVEYMAHHEAHHTYQMFQRRSLIDVKVPH